MCGGYVSLNTGRCRDCGHLRGTNWLPLVLGGAILFGSLIVIQLAFLFGGLVSVLLFAWIATLRQLGAPPAAYAVSALVGVLALIVYLTPAIVASKRHLRNSTTVWLLDVFLGWTVIGWIIALAMAVGGRRGSGPARGVGPPARVSPDRSLWWDGRRWQPMPHAQLGSPQVSSDGRYVWDAQRQVWLPIHRGPMPPPLLPPTR
jgi:T4 superinfection immunity protein